jgi:predicted cobalt transporter CbtA
VTKERKMKTLPFIAVTLLSGAIAGMIFGIINQGLVEPFIDKAIAIETQKYIATGQVIDPLHQKQYRLWQKSGEIVAATILGISLAALVGIVFAYGRNSLPGSTNKKKALVLSWIMFLVLFLVPALKYPPNPPTIGDPATIYYREGLYVTFLCISGFTTLGIAILCGTRQIANNQHYTSITKVLIALVIYVSIIGSTYAILPNNPDKITIPSDLLMNFRMASAISMAIFWSLMGLIFGTMWDKFKPHQKAEITPT